MPRRENKKSMPPVMEDGRVYHKQNSKPSAIECESKRMSKKEKRKRNDEQEINTKQKRKNRRKRKSLTSSSDNNSSKLTPTQARNARKRRAKKCPPSADKTKRIKKTPLSGNGTNDNDDPSTKYIKNPTNTPLITESRSYFASLNVAYKVIPVKRKTGWRTVSKLPVRKCGSRIVVGLFRPRSHRVETSGSQSIVHHDSINRAISLVETTICQQKNRQIEPYDEDTGEGALRYVCLNTDPVTNKIQLTLVWNGNDDDDDDDDTLLNRFVDDLASLMTTKQCLHSIWIHVNRAWKHSNAIYDVDGKNSWTLKRGPPAIKLSLDVPGTRVTLHFPPHVFRQANLEAFTDVIVRVRERVERFVVRSSSSSSSKATIVELYGGVGTIGLHLTSLCSEYICSDENPHNERCFADATSTMASAESAKCRYVPKNARDVVSSGVLRDADVVIVDPPRRGLEKEVLDALSSERRRRRDAKPTLLVYVSCGFRAFRRDCDALLASERGWVLDDVVEGHVLFPGSDAVETLAFFTSGLI